MNIAENKLIEYNLLRTEINQKIELHNTLLTFTLTTVVAILTFILAQDQPFNPLLFLLPFCILIPMSMRIAYYRSAMARLSAYMIVFLEPCMPGINWETRNINIVHIISTPNSNLETKNIASNDSASDNDLETKNIAPNDSAPDGNYKLSPMNENTSPKKLGLVGKDWTQRLLMGHYYECLVLSILCYFLYAYHYLKGNATCLITIANLCWPMLLVILEFLITVKIDSINRSKQYWINQWKELGKSECTDKTADLKSRYASIIWK